MPDITLISGPCGCGKTTFADVYAKHLAFTQGKTVCVIHGDDFHGCFVEPEARGELFKDGRAADPPAWEEILSFNWDCILFTAQRALRMNADAVIDYVVEDELPRVRELAKSAGARLYYIVLTADEEEIKARIRRRGDTGLTERALFLKNELEAMPENRGHIYDNTHKTPEDMIAGIDPEQFRVVL